MTKQVEIFTDGSCLGNPGPGGYGIVLRYKKVEKTLAEGFTLTTNNRMEMMATIKALEAIKPGFSGPVVLFTDSTYVLKGITEWIHGWKKRGWVNASKKPVRNAELWHELIDLTARHKVDWHWVKGHSGHPENDRVDKLASDAAEAIA